METHNRDLYIKPDHLPKITKGKIPPNKDTKAYGRMAVKLDIGPKNDGYYFQGTSPQKKKIPVPDVNIYAALGVRWIISCNLCNRSVELFYAENANKYCYKMNGDKDEVINKKVPKDGAIFKFHDVTLPTFNFVGRSVNAKKTPIYSNLRGDTIIQSARPEGSAVFVDGKLVSPDNWR